MQTETDLKQALRRCPKPDLGCRIENIHSFGLSGLSGAFGGVSVAHQPDDPGPSYTTIERAMNVVFKVVGYFLGKEFKLLEKAFKLVYKPHFKLLKMFDKTFDRYWGGLEFTRWALQALTELEKNVRSYLFHTGHFEFRRYLTHFSRLQGRDFDAALVRLKGAGSVLHEFDTLLIADIGELIKAIDKGLDQVLEMKPASTVPDQIALGTLMSEMTGLSLTLDQSFRSTLAELVRHQASWGSVDGRFTAAVSFDAPVRNLSHKIKKVINEVEKKFRGSR